MNRVGQEARVKASGSAGSCTTTLTEFAPHAEARRDTARAQRWQRTPLRSRWRWNATVWDGDWYRRAYFDDGTPLGSASNEECRIDSIAQSWAVISGART